VGEEIFAKQDNNLGSRFEAVKSITAGENVRSFSGQYNGETGKFIIESGRTTFSAPEVILEGGFEVKKGASLEIK
jgi:hypothetical protein